MPAPYYSGGPPYNSGSPHVDLNRAADDFEADLWRAVRRDEEERAAKDRRQGRGAGLAIDLAVLGWEDLR